MNRWLNRVAVVTGASSGIGAACCKDLVAKGMVVVGLARRESRLKQLKSELPPEQAKRFQYRRCDVGVEQQVIDAFLWIERVLGGVDVLVNNAGVIRPTMSLVSEGNSADVHAILNTNVLGVTWCTREAFLSLQRRKVNDGHVLIVNSISGHRVPVLPHISFNMYAPSKHAITAMTEVLRQEFLNSGTKTKVTSISPGGVDTEIIPRQSMPPHGVPVLRAEDVADAISYCIQTPPNVQIHELTIRPVGEMI